MCLHLPPLVSWSGQLHLNFRLEMALRFLCSLLTFVQERVIVQSPLSRSARGRNQSLRRRACRLSLAGFWFSAARAFSAVALFAVCSTADTRCGSHRVIPNEAGECSLTNDPLSNRSVPM